MTTRTRTFRDANAQAAATAHLQKQNSTCEGCAALRQLRPMCQDERSPNYRRAIDGHHERCVWYAVKGQQAKPAPTPEPPPASRAEIGGEVSKRKHNRWARGATA